MERNDPVLERNLDQIGRSVPLPDDPTPQQLMRWTGTGQADDALDRRRRLTIMRRIWMTGGFGIAAAVTLMFGTLLSAPRPALAAELFSKMRSAIERSRLARIEFRDVVYKEYKLQLVAHVTMDETGGVTAARIASKNVGVGFGYDEPDFSIQWDMTGSAHEHIFASSDKGAWSYLKLTKLADDFHSRNPDAQLVQPLVDAAMDGVYIDRQRRLGGAAVYFTANLNVLGLADREKFSNCIKMVEEKAAEISVERLPNGRNVLRAANYQGRTGEVFQLFTWQGRRDELIDAAFAGAAFEVTFDGDQIEVIRITNVADGGQIEVRFDNEVTDFSVDLFDQAAEKARTPAESIDNELLRKLKPGGRKS
ncbi:MAG: hypothetical protein SF069_15875 [Phycisphaerae bacterium]|nr:hypothetical protein [Phycisphaerae bacterium]